MNSLFKKVVSFVSAGALLATMMLPGGIMTSATSTPDQGTVTLSKTAAAKSGTTNQWNVMLTVQGKNLIKASSADFVLVIDLSNSMKGDKLAKAKAAAASFATGILTSSHPGAKIAIVGFNESSVSGCGLKNYTSVAAVTAAINNLAIDSDSDKGGTNIQAGLKAAENLLGASSEASISSKNIILLSDGEPTYSYQGNATTTASPSWADGTSDFWGNATKYNYYVTGFDYSGHIGSGGSYNLGFDGYTIGDWWSGTQIRNNGIGTVSEAKIAKNAGYNIITVGCDIANDTVAKAILSDVASGSANFHLSASDDLASTYASILSQISLPAATAATVSDPIGDEFTLVDGSIVASAGTSYDVSADKRTITWTIGTVQEGTDPTLTYAVQIKSGATYNYSYPTNGTTTMNYTDVDGGSASKDFTVPTGSINGYTVHYYVKGSTNTVIGLSDKTADAAVGSTVTETAPSAQGYSFDSSVGNPLTVSATGSNVIIFYYTQNAPTDESYTINYHMPDNTVDTTNGSAAAGTGISADLTKTPAGYHIISVKYNTNNDVTISNGNYTMALQDGSNVMDVYYTANTESYTINYHLPSGTVSSSDSAAYGASVAANLTKTPTGYHISSVKYNTSTEVALDNGNYTMTLGEGSNVMDVYYAGNPTTYTVHYYLQNSNTGIGIDDKTVNGTVGADVTEDYVTKGGYTIVGDTEKSITL
ncbi:MAG: VWA domain-containing protein, partial [Negativicutes bacterium]|nr:VWA domain-containing protein [Negativicutes bacterium]